MLNLINIQPDICIIYLYAKDPYEVKNKYLINNRENIKIRHLDYPNAFIEYSNDILDVHKNIEEYNSGKENMILMAFDYMITDMISNKKLNSVVFELFTRGRKLNMFLVFVTQSYGTINLSYQG